ncbi:MAG: cytochrome P450 [Polyangiales bacterium]
MTARPFQQFVADTLFGGRRRAGEPPLVRGAPLLGSALPFGRDAPAFLADCRRRHGDIFTLVVAGQRMTFVLDPHSHAAVLKRQGELSFHELAHEISARAFGHTRLQGERATAMERATAAHLKGPALAALTDRAQQRLDAWLRGAQTDPDTPVALYAFVRRALFVVGAETLFGEGPWDDAARVDFERFDHHFPLLVAGVPAAALGVRGVRARLAARLRPGASGASEMCRRRAEALGDASPAEVGRVDLSVLWAALANTIPAAFWTLAHLATEPAARARVTREVRDAAAVATSPPARPRLQSAIAEALRLSSASITLRRALRDTTLTLDDGATYALRAGDLVCLFPWLMHHDAEIFPEPERFRDDRFLPDAPPFLKRGRRLATPLMPYGGGVSLCPGRHIANTEIQQFVAAVLTRFDLVAAEPAVPPPERTRAGLGVLPPRGDLRVYLRPATATP